MPYIDPSVIEQVKRIDLLTYLQNYEPDELVRLSSSTCCTKTHDSLKISNAKPTGTQTHGDSSRELYFMNFYMSRGRVCHLESCFIIVG